MTAAVDADIFDCIMDAVKFVASRGGGVVRIVRGTVSPNTEYFKGLTAEAAKKGVKLEIFDPNA